MESNDRDKTISKIERLDNNILGPSTVLQHMI